MTQQSSAAPAKHCEEYQRLLDRQILLALAQMCGARVANPEAPEERLRRHKSTCAKCKALRTKGE